MFVVSGVGPTMADFTIESTITFRYSDAIITGTGRYAGFALYDVSGRDHGGVVAMPELSDPARPMPIGPHTVFANGITKLPPGRYRVYLLADKDKQAEVRLPLGSGDGLTVQTAKPIRQTYRSDRHAFTAGETKAALRLPLVVNARTRTYIFAQLGRGTADYDVRVCVAKRDSACRPEDFSVTSTAPAFGTAQSGVGFPAWMIRGARDARAEAVTKPGPTATMATAFLGLVVIQLDLIT